VTVKNIWVAGDCTGFFANHWTSNSFMIYLTHTVTRKMKPNVASSKIVRISYWITVRGTFQLKLMRCRQCVLPFCHCILNWKLENVAMVSAVDGQHQLIFIAVPLPSMWHVEQDKDVNCFTPKFVLYLSCMIDVMMLPYT
jgi:hypothetical protein